MKLGWITVGFTFLLMVWGNIVSATGSGLACPDWPLCHGTATPPIRPDIVLEWGHRLLAATATILIVATMVSAFRSKADPALKRSGRALLALLAVQIVLGGVTVMLGLSILASTTHLIIANLVMSGLITVAGAMSWGKELGRGGSEKLRRLAVAGLGAMLIQLALGALVRHGRAGLACPNFPNCINQFFPIPVTFETVVAFIHRWWGILMLAIFIHIAVAARRSSVMVRATGLILALAAAQVLLGIFTVQYGLHTHLRATHAAVGYGLWALLYFVALRSGAFQFLWKNANPSHGSPGPIDTKRAPSWA